MRTRWKWCGVVIGVALAGCDERPTKPAVVDDAPAYARKKADPVDEVKSEPPRVKPEPATSCKAAYERAAAALAKRDFIGVAETIDRPVLEALTRNVTLPANFGVMGHALSTSGPKGSVDALAAILNKYGAMLTVEERLKGLDLDGMAGVTSARASRDAEGFIGALLEWADDAGYPGDPLAAINGAQSENPTVAVAVPPGKDLVGAIVDSTKSGELPKPKIEHAPASADSLQPLLALLLTDAKVTETKKGRALTVSAGKKVLGTVACAESGGWFLTRQ